MVSNPSIELNNGVAMPRLGLGVFRSAPEQTKEAVLTAIAAGYRLVDTASLYGNEEQVGEAVRVAPVDRSELFVTTKLWIADYGYDAALRGFDASLRRLGLDYVDMYLLHWPVPGDFDQTVASYRAAERILEDRMVRAIGVCNHNPDHLRELIRRTEVVPAVNQVELHPWFIQRAVRAADGAHGIVTQSWSPIGGVYTNHPADPHDVKTPLEEPAIADLAEKYRKTPGQIVLRWHIQHGLAAVPKSINPTRIIANLEVFDFDLTESEMDAVDALDTRIRGGADPDSFDLQVFAAAYAD